IAQLQPHYEVLAIVLLGYGNAPAAAVAAAESFRFADELPRIIAAIQQANWAQPVHLGGHSYGGALAVKLGLGQPFAVASLTVFEPVAFHILDAQDSGRQQVERIAGQMDQLARADATAKFVDYWNHDGFFAALPARVQQVMIAQTEKVILDFAALM